MLKNKLSSYAFFLVSLALLVGCNSELTVNNGEGSGKYRITESVTIKANEAESGERFHVWEGDVSGVEDKFAAETVIRLLSPKVSVTATYIAGDIKHHASIANGSGGGDYTPGDLVNIEADEAADGFSFNKWTGDANLLSDPKKSKQSFRMPDKDVSLRATYKDTSTDDQIRYDVVKVFTAASDTYKLVGMLGTKHGLFVTTSRVYKGSNNSRIYLDGKLIYHGKEETVGQPFEWNGQVHFPVEHGDNSIVWKNGALAFAARTRGRWSIAGTVYNGRPIMAYNNNFNGAFNDTPNMHDAITGAKVFGFNAKDMPRKFVNYKGDLWASLNFGENVLMNRSGRKIASEAVHIEVYNGTLYGGGGVNWGPILQPDGRMFRFDGSKFKEIMNTGSTSVQHMAVLNGRLWIAAPDPDRLFVMGSDGVIHKVAEILGESSSDRARDFGASVAYHDGFIYWGRSDKSRAHVYKLVPK
jgi:hypothetical protein